MRAGSLDQRITIQQPPTTLDAGGEAQGDWTTFADVWARVEPLRGRQLEAARTVYGDVGVQINMRYIDGVKIKMRVKHDAKTYQIEAVMNIQSQNRELELLCSEAQ